MDKSLRHDWASTLRIAHFKHFNIVDKTEVIYEMSTLFDSTRRRISNVWVPTVMAVGWQSNQWRRRKGLDCIASASSNPSLSEYTPRIAEVMQNLLWISAMECLSKRVKELLWSGSDRNGGVVMLKVGEMFFIFSLVISSLMWRWVTIDDFLHCSRRTLTFSGQMPQELKILEDTLYL
jgi:hypothetical protein